MSPSDKQDGGENASTAIKRLASYMRLRSEQGERPYNLFLGAGASVPSAYLTAAQFVDRFLTEIAGLDITSMDEEQKRGAFDNHWQLAGETNTAAFVNRVLPPVTPSRGYMMLSSMARLGYFSTILTTNVDTLLEQAFYTSDAASTRSAAFLSYPQYGPKEIADALSSALPPIKVVKLHGDLRSGRFLFTTKQLERFPRELVQALRGVLHRDTIYCGYGFNDQDVTACLKSRPQGYSAPSVFCVSPNPPAPDVRQTLDKYAGGLQWVSGELGDFDQFMDRLAQEVIGYDPAARATFNSRFHSGSFEGIQAIAGPCWTEGKALTLGNATGQAAVQVGRLSLGEAVIDVKGSFVSKRGLADWFGIAASEYWSLGHLAYVRGSGELEMLSRDGILAASDRPVDVSRAFHLRVTTSKASVGAELLGPSGNVLSRAVKPVSQLNQWVGGVYLHTFFTRVRLESISVQPFKEVPH